jgi:hypothetical protein
MTGLNLISLQDSILAHVETSFPSYEIIEDYVIDDQSLLKVGNKLKPYIVLRWHGLRRSFNDASFGGVRKDSYTSGFDVIAVAPTPKQSRSIINMVMGELIGWKVADLYPLTPQGGGDFFTMGDYDSKPQLYMSINTLVFQVDSNALTT